MLLTIHLSDDTLESMWSKLVNKDGNRAPLDVLRAFAGLGGADAEAVYCTSYADGSSQAWSVVAVDGDLLIYVLAKGPGVWREDDDAAPASLEAFTTPIRSYVSAIRIDDAAFVSQPGDFLFGRRRPISPLHPTWVLTKGPNAGPAGTDSIRLPRVNDQHATSQCEKAEAVAEAIRRRLVGRS